MHIERLGVAYVVGAPHPVDEHIAGQDAARVLDQEPQELELLAPQVDLLAADEDAALVLRRILIVRVQQARDLRLTVQRRERLPHRRDLRGSALPHQRTNFGRDRLP